MKIFLEESDIREAITKHVASMGLSQEVGDIEFNTLDEETTAKVDLRETGTQISEPAPKAKRKRRTKAELEAAKTAEEQPTQSEEVAEEEGEENVPEEPIQPVPTPVVETSNPKSIFQ